MNTNKSCKQRPFHLACGLQRATKPPDIESIAYIKLKSDLDYTRRNLSAEQKRSKSQQKEIDELRCALAKAIDEKREAIAKCVNIKLELNRLTAVSRRQEKQLQMKSSLLNESLSEKQVLVSEMEVLKQQRRADIQTFSSKMTSTIKEMKIKKSNETGCLRLMQIYIGVLHAQIRTNQSELKDKTCEYESRLKCFEGLLVCQLEKGEAEATLHKTEIKNLKGEVEETKGCLRKVEEELGLTIMDRDDARNQCSLLAEEVSSLKKELDLLRRNSLRRDGEAEEKLQKEKWELMLKNKKVSAELTQLQAAYDEVLAKVQSDIENKDIQTRMKSVMERRRDTFNEIQDLRGNIRVFCRIRPSKDGSSGQPFIKIPTATTGNNWRLVCKDESFSFDRVFQPTATNGEVYKETARVVEMVLEGRNVCILAYGQTGSGKTYTMEGVQDDPGVNVLALRDLFQKIEENGKGMDVFVSVLEIYNDEIQDLLVSGVCDKKNVKKTRCAQRATKKLDIRRVSATSEEVHIPGLTKQKVQSETEARSIMESAQRKRSVSSTEMNRSSSRSHLVVEVEVRLKQTTEAGSTKLHLVDLAGSERVQRSKVTGDRFKEAVAINKSLSTLGSVFSSLEQHRTHVPYRDTKLTYLLKDSIGGQSKTLMFINISGERADGFETSATLEFGKRVGRIVKTENRTAEKLQRLRILERDLEEFDKEIAAIEDELNE